MKRFILKILLVLVLFLLVNALALFVIPKDENGYLCAYLDKIEILERTQQPRIILIGGSSVAFGTDSQMIVDSLGINVVNFGMQGGIGIRYMVDDCQQYIKRGDFVVLQFEYANYFNGGYGEPENFSGLMVATGFRNFGDLSLKQVSKLYSLPRLSAGAIIRLFKYPFTGSFNTITQTGSFTYTRDGFNKYGDEVSHFDYPSAINIRKGKGVEDEIIDDSFLDWLVDSKQKMERNGAKVLLIPPVNITSNFRVTYSPKIEEKLNERGLYYLCSPESMVLPDSLTFDGGYHVNREGATRNTLHIIDVLSDKITSVY